MGTNGHSVITSVAPAALLILATTRCLNRCGLKLVPTCVYWNDVASVCALLKAIITFHLKLLSFEFVTFFDKVVYRVLTCHLDSLHWFLQDTKLFEDGTIKLRQNQIFVVVLQLALTDHLIYNILQCVAKDGSSIYGWLRFLLLHMCIGISLGQTSSLNHFSFHLKINYKHFFVLISLEYFK